MFETLSIIGSTILWIISVVFAAFVIFCVYDTYVTFRSPFKKVFGMRAPWSVRLEKRRHKYMQMMVNIGIEHLRVCKEQSCTDEEFMALSLKLAEAESLASYYKFLVPMTGSVVDEEE